MKVAVFDTYVRTGAGEILHFDVLLPESDGQYAEAYARRWVQEIGLPAASVQLEVCRFCHSEIPSPEVTQQIRQQGYSILQMEGCPAPV